jgi:succinate dehydrogenase/fumarate reductase flavoprotein subunit
MTTQTLTIADWPVNQHHCHTLIVGAGAAGMNCAVHLAEFLQAEGVSDPAGRIIVATRGVGLGASRMSGSDKQTYYKMGTSDAPDSPADFAAALTAAGCCHEDLALAEGIGSLREFYHLVRAGVPFPHDDLGRFVGYKTDHDPIGRATSAGPKTSKFMSEALQAEVEGYGITIHDRREFVELLVDGDGDGRRAIGAVMLHVTDGRPALDVYLAANVVLAAGGPGNMYAASVYPPGQIGIHGLAMKAGLAAENLTESQFGLASTSFRWNVSGTYMQVVPHIYSTDAAGDDRCDFLSRYFPSMASLATATFLKGYQWPFDPQRVTEHQSSLIDLAVFMETSRGRRVWMDFRNNPQADGLDVFDLHVMDAEARNYLLAAGATQTTPIDRLAHMNQAAIDIYAEHGIDLRNEPLEIAVCAQHCNGGLAVSHWWESTVKRAFVVGELAGTHGVKRPGGSALNAGQVGSLRAAEYIVKAYGTEMPARSITALEVPLQAIIDRFERWAKADAEADLIVTGVQARMTAHGGHIRHLASATQALEDAVVQCDAIEAAGVRWNTPRELAAAIQAENIALTSAATLKAIVALLQLGAGSRGSHLVLDDTGEEIHSELVAPATNTPLRVKAEATELRERILQVTLDRNADDGFSVASIPIRRAVGQEVAFELAWKAYNAREMFRE